MEVKLVLNGPRGVVQEHSRITLEQIQVVPELETKHLMKQIHKDSHYVFGAK